MRMVSVLFLIAVFSWPSSPCLADDPKENQADSEKLKEWKHNSELAFAQASGNSSTLTVNAKQSTSYFWTQNLLRLEGHYLYALASRTESAKNWSSVLRYERNLSEKFSVFVAQGWQGDRFAGYDYRAIADLGVKYNVIGKVTDKDYLVTEAGYRFQYEEGNAFSRRSQIARAYVEANKSLSAFLSANTFVEALPDLVDTKNFMLNFQLALSVAVDSHLSLKVSYLGRYDGSPASTSAKDFDSLLSTALVATY